LYFDSGVAGKCRQPIEFSLIPHCSCYIFCFLFFLFILIPLHTKGAMASMVIARVMCGVIIMLLKLEKQPHYKTIIRFIAMAL